MLDAAGVDATHWTSPTALSEGITIFLASSLTQIVYLLRHNRLAETRRPTEVQLSCQVRILRCLLSLQCQADILSGDSSM